MRACTIVASNYLAHARVLVRSFQQQHPGASFTVLLLDGSPEREETVDGADVVSLGDIGLEPADAEWMPLIYDVTELSTAVKPWLLRTLLRRGEGPVLYFDPDIEIFRSLEQLAELAREHSIVLTPHVTEPMPRDGRKPRESDILATGVYNLGFIAVAPGSESFLDYWAARLRRDCIIEPTEMLFTDQRWVDFAPGFFRHHILRDATCNVAYWNLQNREVRWDGNRYLVNGQPLTFFHFSGYDPDRPEVLSKHQGLEPRIMLEEHPGVARLCREYAVKLAAAGHAEAKWKSYRFNALSNGVSLNKGVRRLVRDALLRSEAGQGEQPPSPWRAGGEESFVEWLNEPATDGVSITRYMLGLHGSRADLRKRFPEPLGYDAQGFRLWLTNGGADECRIPASFVPAEFGDDEQTRRSPLDDLSAALMRLHSAGNASRSPAEVETLAAAQEKLESVRALQGYLDSTARTLRAHAEQYRSEIWELKAKRADATARAQNAESQLHEIERSTIWKLIKPLWKLTGRPLSQTKKAASDIIYRIETPSDWRANGETVEVQGWCFSRSRQIVGLRARVGRKGFLAQYGIERLDIARLHDSSSAARDSGFAISLQVPANATTIALDCIVQGGQWEQFFGCALKPK